MEQLPTGHPPRLLTLMSILAWRLYWMSRVGRLDRSLSCALVLAPHEWQALYAKTQKKKPPKRPPTLQEALIWVAQLGGFNARKSDGFPGSKTIWKGWTRLVDYADACYFTKLMGKDKVTCRVFRLARSDSNLHVSATKNASACPARKPSERWAK